MNYDKAHTAKLARRYTSPVKRPRLIFAELQRRQHTDSVIIIDFNFSQKLRPHPVTKTTGSLPDTTSQVHGAVTGLLAA